MWHYAAITKTSEKKLDESCGATFDSSVDGNMERSELEADLQLRMQRSLAQKVLERSNLSETSSFHESLRTSTSDSLPNLSSQSCAESEKPEHNKDNSLFHFLNNMKSGSICNKKQMDTSSSSFESFTIKRSAHSTPNAFPLRLKSEKFHSFGDDDFAPEDAADEFMPADQLQDKLLADEKSWKRMFGDFPTNESQIKHGSDASGFSGISGDAEITVGSSVLGCGAGRKKIPVDEFFHLKNDDLNKRPFFGIDVTSPDGKQVPQPLIDSSSLKDTSDSSLTDSEMPYRKLKVSERLEDITSESSPISVISVSSIQKLMSEEENLCTPRTLFQNLVNFDSKKPVATKPLKQTVDNKESSAKSDSYWIEDKEAFSCKTDGKTQVEEQDDTADKAEEDRSWVNFVVNGGKNLTAGVGLESQLFLTVENMTNRRLKCRMKLHKINSQNVALDSNNPAAHINFPSREAIINPKTKKEAKVCFILCAEGPLRITVNVFLEDMATKETQQKYRKFNIIGEQPKIQITVNDISETRMDFGMLPENCTKHLPITVFNRGNFDAPVCIAVEECCNLPVFSITTNTDDDMDTCESGGCMSSTCILRANSEQIVIIIFKAPSLQQIAAQTETVELSSELKVLLNLPSTERKILQKLSLLGHVARTRLLLLRKSLPINLVCDVGQRVTQSFSLKNDGAMPLNLSLKIVDERFKEVHDDIIQVEPKHLVVTVKQKSSVDIIFQPQPTLKSVLRLLFVEIQPNGQLFKIDIYGKVAAAKEQHMEGKNKNLPVQIRNDPCSQKVLSSNGVSTQGAINGSGSVSAEIASSRSSQSRNSTSRLPLAATQKELVWSSVPIGQLVMESFMLRNEGNYTMKLHISLQDPTGPFKILTEQQKSVKDLKIALQSMERVKLNISFEPLRLGAAHDKLIFKKYPHQELSAKLVFPLYAYGGHHRITIKGVPKDGTGHMWLCIGALDYGKPCMEAYFIISNSGTLDAFAIVNATTKGLEFLKKSAITVEPSKFIIPAGSSSTVKITYHAQQDLLKYFISAAKDVLEIGVLSILTGDEPTRQRLRRLWNDMKSKTTCNSLEQYSFMDLSSICEAFAGEKALTGLELLRDPEQAVDTLCRSFVQQDISLTVENSGEKTYGPSSGLTSDCSGSQTQFFTSLYNETVDETIKSSSEAGFESGNQSSFWSISAESLVLLPPRITEGCIQVFSKSRGPQIFETQLNNRFLAVTPAEGVVPPNGEVTITVSCSALPKSTCKEIEAVLKIYLENDVKHVRIVIKQGM
ncbi:uncharacterized protein LOC124594792 [Schistocerca americana]|uniref:uncharacterized protein LOC124594792 n=1 Tax=Schistocerca americana TaxID=7009 RepID=UPI001F4F2D1B|nr:uncharacterized protein LOC124594792 [Schistocerca americana]